VKKLNIKKLLKTKPMKKHDWDKVDKYCKKHKLNPEDYSD